MGLKMKSFKEILVDMADWVANKSNRLIDFSEGSVIRTLLEAVATEIEEYYFKTYINMQYAMENSLYDAFGHSRREATPAYGTLKITLNNPLTHELYLEKGTIFYASTRNNKTTYYSTQIPYKINVGVQTFEIVVYANVAGSEGNTLANTITHMTNHKVEIATITNPQAFTNGTEAETLEERRERFSQFIESRSKGTKKAIEYGTLEVSGVAGCYVDDSTTGIIRVYAHDSYGNLSNDLKESVAENLENYRSAGIPLFVLPITKKVVDVDIKIEVLPAYNVLAYKESIESSIYDFFNIFELGQDFMISDLNAYIRNLDGIAIKNCKVLTPTGDIEVTKKELVTYGNISIELIDYED